LWSSASACRIDFRTAAPTSYDPPFIAITTRRFRGDAGCVDDPCVTVCICPAIVSVPVRELPVVFGDTVNVSVRDPEPAWLNVIQPDSVVAVQKQEDPVVKVTVNDPPPGPAAWLAGLIE
jgi:hypothetical protein